jgi:RNA-directed DNA polymerase
VTQVLGSVGLAPAESKTGICHVEEGFDFLGFRVKRRRRRGTDEHAIYTYPSRRSLAAVKAKVRALTNRAKHRTLADLLQRLNPLLRGWCAYFRHVVSKRTFGYIDHFAFWRVVGWIRKRHPGIAWRTLRRRYLPGWEIRADGIELYRPRKRPVSRYRYRGSRIPTPWTSTDTGSAASPRPGLVESRMR